MPIPRNWSEELVFEWLALQGYLTEVGVPIGVGKGGGRLEADVIGTRIKKTSTERQILEIFHIEIGSLPSSYEMNAKRLLKKFSDSHVNAVKHRVKTRLGDEWEVEYKKLYIDTWASENTAKKLSSRTELKRERIDVWTMTDLYQHVFEAIVEWKANPPYKVTPSDNITLPECHWLLKLIEDLKRKKVINLQAFSVDFIIPQSASHPHT